MELKQRRLWDRRDFKLLADGIWIRIRTPIQDIELKVKYEELGLDEILVRKKEANIIYISLLFFGSIAGRLILNEVDTNNTNDRMLMIVLFAFFGILCLLAWTDASKSILIISGGVKTFSLLRSSPNQKSVDVFVAALRDNIMERNIQLHVKLDDPKINANYKKSILDSLLEQGLISKEKYDQISKKIELVPVKIRKNTDFPGFSLN